MKTLNSDVLDQVVLTLCESIDSPRSLSTWLCYKYNQEELLNLPRVDTSSLATEQVQENYFLSEYLSKYKGLKLSLDPGKVALDKWILAEHACFLTNRKFDSELQSSNDCAVAKILFKAKRKIAQVLGNPSVGRVLQDARWGPGSTYDIRRSNANPGTKMSYPISVTASALPYLKKTIESDPDWAAVLLGIKPEGPFSLLRHCFNTVEGNRLVLVDKSAKTKRVICAEPTGNSFLQQGPGRYIRKRLKQFGVDLDDQSRNQQFAEMAYVAGYATVDKRSASDLISRSLCFHLLPIDWALFLDDLRSKRSFVFDRWVTVEKFASMGNAFCFELESLIFWALAVSICDEDEVDRVSVFGDDVILPARHYSTYVSICEFCGFEINLDKSYSSGYFYESCGKHYHRGTDVTPVYQKEPISTPSELIRAHNRLSRFENRCLSERLKIGLKKACRILSEKYSLRPFPRIPYGAQEDGGFLRPWTQFESDRFGRGFRCHVLDYVPRNIEVHEGAFYARKLRNPVYLNILSNGQCSWVSEGKWRTRVRHIARHTLAITG